MDKDKGCGCWDRGAIIVAVCAKTPGNRGLDPTADTTGLVQCFIKQKVNLQLVRVKTKKRPTKTNKIKEKVQNPKQTGKTSKR